MARWYRRGDRRNVPCAGIQFVDVCDQSINLRHCGKLFAFNIRSAAGYQQPGIGPFPAGAADGLACLADGLCRYRAAVDYHQIALTGQHGAKAFAFRQVQPASERDDFC